MNTPYINTSFLNGFSALILSKGGNLASIYESAGMDKDFFLKEDALPSWVSEKQSDKTENVLIPFYSFIDLLEAAAEQLDFPEVAMQLARQQDMMILAPMSPLLKDCENISQALEVILKYIKILVSGYQVEIETKGDSLIFSFSLELPDIQEKVQYQDYAIASAVSILRGLLGKSYPVRACYFLRSERDTRRHAEYSRYYGCPVAFNCQSLSMVVDSSILKQDIGQIIKHLNARINRTLARQNENIIEQVSKVISFSLANGHYKIKAIANAMNQSERTLQRKLGEQNTSYSALLDSVRFNMANQYLKNTSYRLTDIAALLGYRNLSAFSRSYSRWCGIAPVEVRKRLQNNIS